MLILLVCSKCFWLLMCMCSVLLLVRLSVVLCCYCFFSFMCILWLVSMLKVV